MREWKTWYMPKVVHGVPTKYGWTVYYPEKFVLMENTDIGWGTFINARHGVVIKEGVQIGPFCAILSDNSINETSGPILIGENARIGAYSLILPNTEIMADAFIKAYSIIPQPKNNFFKKTVYFSESMR